MKYDASGRNATFLRGGVLACGGGFEEARKRGGEETRRRGNEEARKRGGEETRRRGNEEDSVDEMAMPHSFFEDAVFALAPFSPISHPRRD
jgi:hypothetical protein